MSLTTLDLLFPFFVFAYGAVVTLALHIPAVVELAERRLPPELKAQLNAHRGLALFALLAGGAWTLQNLWLPAQLF